MLFIGLCHSFVQCLSGTGCGVPQYDRGARSGGIWAQTRGNISVELSQPLFKHINHTHKTGVHVDVFGLAVAAPKDHTPRIGCGCRQHVGEGSMCTTVAAGRRMALRMIAIR